MMKVVPILVLLFIFALSNVLTKENMIIKKNRKLVFNDLNNVFSYNPGDNVTSFSVPTLQWPNGNTGGMFKYIPVNSNEQYTNSLIIHAWNIESAFYSDFWNHDLYIKELLIHSPNDTDYLFLYYENENVENDEIYKYMFKQLSKQVNSLGYENNWAERLFVSSSSVEQLTNFLPELLNEWEDVLNQVAVFPENTSQNTTYKRLDGRWPNIQGMTQLLPPGNYSVANFGDGCDLSNVQNVTNRIALISRDNITNNETCSYVQKILHAQKRGAVGVVVYSNKDEPLIDMNCHGLECDIPPQIPACMIQWDAGQIVLSLLDQNETIIMQFIDTPTSGFNIGIDTISQLQELGYLMFPSGKFFAWPAQYFNYMKSYYQNLNRLKTAPDAINIPIFTNLTMDGNEYTNVTIPNGGSLEFAKWGDAFLDLSLDCTGPKDSSCPAWDRILTLKMCCDYTQGENDTNIHNVCGQEVGRWITPFGRRVGRWLTNVTDILPLFSTNGLLETDPQYSSLQCTFSISCGTTEPWVPTVSLRLANKKKINNTLPFQITPLFEGGTFNSNYNNRSAYNFFVPSNVSKVELYSVITGHGSDNNGCGEFCVTSHHFNFNNITTYNRTFSNAGTPEGCSRETFTGVIPNEYGTWLYGRDGWCDGRNVFSWKEDVSSSIYLNKNNTVSYYGWFQGHTPDPTQSPGYIVMASYAIFYN
eukprot:TRINITY_DN12520_c0_g1_i2.p1 TRINITY_DN12520_c0_g1~~TRINITY_DN12520_c0_g1_i2.p1  ORF type:complete len:700 (+),score=197.71 TRINITY_DN12520_c0_g1_i2:31-2130(+)